LDAIAALSAKLPAAANPSIDVAPKAEVPVPAKEDAKAAEPVAKPSVPTDRAIEQMVSNLSNWLPPRAPASAPAAVPLQPSEGGAGIAGVKLTGLSAAASVTRKMLEANSYTRIAPMGIEKALADIFVPRTKGGMAKYTSEAQEWLTHISPEYYPYLVLACKTYSTEPSTALVKFSEDLEKAAESVQFASPSFKRITEQKVKVFTAYHAAITAGYKGSGKTPSHTAIFSTASMAAYCTGVHKMLQRCEPTKPEFLYSKGSFMTFAIGAAIKMVSARWFSTGTCIENKLKVQRNPALDAPLAENTTDWVKSTDVYVHVRAAFTPNPFHLLHNIELRRAQKAGGGKAEIHKIFAIAAYVMQLGEVDAPTVRTTRRGSDYLAAFYTAIKKVRSTLSAIKAVVGGGSHKDVQQSMIFNDDEEDLPTIEELAEVPSTDVDDEEDPDP
jgi:hypothetical protein